MKFFNFFKRSIKNSKTLTLRDVQEDWLPGSGSSSGIYVNERTSMSFSAVWACITRLSSIQASLPLHLYRTVANGKQRARDNSLYALLHSQPNQYMTAMTFREQQMGQVLLNGSCYAEIEFDGKGDVKNLWPLISRDVSLEFDTKTKIPFYRVQLPNSNEQKVLNYHQVLKVNGFSLDGILGLSPIDKNKDSIGLGLALEKYSGKFFNNGARPGAVLEHPGSLSEPAQDRLRKAWDDIHKGLENSHRLAILEEGMKMHEYGIDPEKSQLIESRRFAIEEVARIFGFPLYMLGILDGSIKANVEQQSVEFVTYCLQPWLVRFEQAYNFYLLTQSEKKQYFFEHLVDGLLRGNAIDRHKTYEIGRKYGYYSINDIRKKENLNSIGPEGDIYQPLLGLENNGST